MRSRIDTRSFKRFAKKQIAIKATTHKPPGERTSIPGWLSEMIDLLVDEYFARGLLDKHLKAKPIRNNRGVRKPK